MGERVSCVVPKVERSEKAVDEPFVLIQAAAAAAYRGLLVCNNLTARSLSMP